MIVETKYSIGDKVWIFNPNKGKAQERVISIVEIWVTPGVGLNNNKININYYFKQLVDQTFNESNWEDDFKLKESMVFKNKEELVDSL